MRPRILKSLKIGLPAIAIVAGVMVVTKGRPVAFVDHVFYDGAYMGNSISTNRVVVDDDETLTKLLRDPAYEDFRRVHPDFGRPVTEQINVPGTDPELKRYAAFIRTFKEMIAEDGGKRSDATATRIVRLVSRSYRSRLGGPRKIDDNALGRIRIRPENYVFYLVNAETACGTVAESSVALFRAAGYRARLVTLAHKPSRIEANHVLAEFFSEEQKRWIMIDPTVDFIGVSSVLDVLKGGEMSRSLNKRHGALHYVPSTTAVIDRRGLNRSRFYYSPDRDSRAEIRISLGID